MHILIADSLSVTAVSELEALGLQVTVRPELTAEDIAGAIRDIDVLVVRSTRVTAACLENARSLGLVVRAGSGFNTIDVSTASARGIHVANCPGKNANAVAELAIGLLIAADRQIVDACVDLRNGLWKKKAYGAARGLNGRQLGLLGFGSIGRAVARAAIGLEMRVCAWSRSLDDTTAAEHSVTRAESAEQIADESDAVSIHLPLTDQTRHFINRDFLERMSERSILVNTSRGELVDSEAVQAAITSKQLRFATDVFEKEPAGGEAEFESTRFAAQITATPHIGASTAQTSEAIAAEVVRIVKEYLATGRPPGSVNLCRRSPATVQLVVRHFNQVGVLASVLDGLRGEQINVEEMENMIFEGAHAASCTLRLDGNPSEELLVLLRQNQAILQVEVS